MLSDMHDFGFNVASVANNHCMDFSMEGFLQTLGHVRDAKLYASGGGQNLAEASRPSYIDTPRGRAAVISCTTSYPPGAEAGEQSRDFSGRPGIQMLGVTQTVYVDKEDFRVLSDIMEKTLWNAKEKILCKQGYLTPSGEGTLKIGDTSVKIGAPRTCFDYSAEDFKRIQTAIRDAAFQADVVIVSIHSHQIEGESVEHVPEFLKTFAHGCIDAGAHAVIGHGPHLLRPFELYRGLPIFYSLGDFILHLENCESVPYDFYRRFDCSPDDGLYEVFRRRTKDFTVGLQRQIEMTEAVITSFDIEGGQLKQLKFMPVELGFGLPHSSFGWPRRAKDASILKRYADMSGIAIDKDGTVSL